MNEEVLNLILSHIPKGHKDFYHFELDNIFGCQSTVFAQIFSLIFNREKPSANYLVAAHNPNDHYIFLTNKEVYSFGNSKTYGVDEKLFGQCVPISEDELLSVLENDYGFSALPYEVVDFYNKNKEDVDDDHHNPLWEQSFSTKEEVIEKVKYVYNNFIDSEDPEDCVLKLAELIIDAIELEPVFIDTPQLTPHSEEFLFEKTNSIYEKIKDSETHEFRTKESIFEYLKLSLENQPPNPFYKFNQRLVKILAEFIYWCEDEEMVDEFILPAMEQLEKAGLTGMLEVWEKWQEMLEADLDYHQVFTRLETGETRHVTAQLVPDRLIEEFPTLAELERVILENSVHFILY